MKFTLLNFRVTILKFYIENFSITHEISYVKFQGFHPTKFVYTNFVPTAWL